MGTQQPRGGAMTTRRTQQDSAADEREAYLALVELRERRRQKEQERAAADARYRELALRQSLQPQAHGRRRLGRGDHR